MQKYLHSLSTSVYKSLTPENPRLSNQFKLNNESEISKPLQMSFRDTSLKNDPEIQRQQTDKQSVGQAAATSATISG